MKTEEMQQKFEGFRVKKDPDLFVEEFLGYETRNESTLKLIKWTLMKYDIPNFDWIYVYTGDREPPILEGGPRVLSYATSRGRFENLCPDFTFDHWRQTQMCDYESTRKLLSIVGSRPAVSEKLGWRGNTRTHRNRLRLAKMFNNSKFDIEPIEWKKCEGDILKCSNFISLPEQVRIWRYLIDVEGVGWSARLKLFFFSKRVVFIQQRPFKEWYFPKLRAWVHYVPLLRDLSDLEDKLEFVRSKPSLENRILRHAYYFAEKYLTRDAALLRWKELLT